MKNLMLFTLVLILCSCGSVRAIRVEISQQASDAADQALESAKWAYCEAPSIGAIRREYNTPEKLAAYIESCPGV